MNQIQPRPANRIDDMILSLVGSNSPQEISQMLGGVISAAKVASHTQTLLKQKNWLTAAQEDQVVTLQMRKLFYDLSQRAATDENYKLQLSFLKEISKRLDNRKAATETDLNKLYSNQGRIMGKVVDMALSYMKGALREKVDPELWDTLVEEAMYQAQAEIAKHEAIEE